MSRDLLREEIGTKTLSTQMLREEEDRPPKETVHFWCSFESYRYLELLNALRGRQMLSALRAVPAFPRSLKAGQRMPASALGFAQVLRGVAQGGAIVGHRAQNYGFVPLEVVAAVF